MLNLKRKNYLLIIFLIVLGVYFYRLNLPPAEDSELETTSNATVNTHVNDLIINQNDNSIYNIAINEPTELDFLTKQQVFDIRKKYAAMSPAVIPADYTPSDTVFGQIEDNKPWWGLITTKPGEHSIDGLSEESRFVNNPLLLVGVTDSSFRRVLELEIPGNYPKPTSLSFYPSKKTIIVVYNLLDYCREQGLLNNDGTFWVDGKIGDLVLECINARDFGYNYAYAYSAPNIAFNNKNDNLTTGVYQINDFLHTGGSCRYPGGCNNASPYQGFLYLDAPKMLPASIGIRLWKQKPQDMNSPADLYYIINFQ